MEPHTLLSEQVNIYSFYSSSRVSHNKIQEKLL